MERLFGFLAISATVAACGSGSSAPTQAVGPANPIPVFTGDVSGSIVPKSPAFAPSCQLPTNNLGPRGWVYSAFGSIGKDNIAKDNVILSIQVQPYKGPSTYVGKDATASLGPVGRDILAAQTYRSIAPGTRVVIGSGELSGSIDASMKAFPTFPTGPSISSTAHVRGNFSCTRQGPSP
jgi:hypothetical protein